MKKPIHIQPYAAITLQAPPDSDNKMVSVSLAQVGPWIAANIEFADGTRDRHIADFCAMSAKDGSLEAITRALHAYRSGNVGADNTEIYMEFYIKSISVRQYYKSVLSRDFTFHIDTRPSKKIPEGIKMDCTVRFLSVSALLQNYAAHCT